MYVKNPSAVFPQMSSLALELNEARSPKRKRHTRLISEFLSAPLTTPYDECYIGNGTEPSCAEGFAPAASRFPSPLLHGRAIHLEERCSGYFSEYTFAYLSEVA